MRCRAAIAAVLALASFTACGDDDGGPTTPTEQVASVTVSPDSVSLPVGDTTVLEATVRNQDGDVLQDVDVQWMSQDPEAASVDAEGRVVARRLQRSAIVAAYEGERGRATVVGAPTVGEQTTTVDSTELTLLSDSAERAEGIYRFRVVGDTSVPMDQGRVIVGAQGPGFLREVESRSRSGNVVRLETRQARLTDALPAGELHLEMSMDPQASATTITGARADVGPQAVAGTRFRVSPTRVKHLAEDVRIEDGALVFTHGFGGDNLSVDWRGEIEFSPRAEAHMAWNTVPLTDIEIGVDSVRVTVGGDVRMSAQASATAQTGAQFEESVELASFGRDFVGSIGVVPVKGELEMDVIAGLQSTAEAQATLSTGEAVLDQSARLTLRYTEENQYDFLRDFTSDFQEPDPTFESSARVMARPYVFTEIELTLYEVAGPRAGPMPYVEGEGVAHLSGADHCESHARIYAGLDGVVGIEWTGLGEVVRGWLSIPTIERTFPGPRAQIIDRTWPCSGSLSVGTEPAGGGTDGDGYTVVVDGSRSRSIGVDDRVTFSDLETGDHEVRLEDVASRCTVEGSNPRSVTVETNDDASTRFTVDCEPRTGSLEISTSTTGEARDTDGYTVTVDGEITTSVEPNGRVLFEDLETGDHVVELSGIRSNCSVEGQNPRSVEVSANETTNETISVHCTRQTGDLTVVASTSGEDQDPDGYSVFVDDSRRRSIAADDTTTYEGLQSGDHEVLLSGVASNCVVEGANPRSVSIQSGGAATTRFGVTCESEDSGGEDVTVDFDGLSTGSYGTTLDRRGVTFETHGGELSIITESYHESPALCSSPSGESTCAADLEARFDGPANDVRFIVYGDDEAGTIARVEVFRDGSMVGEVTVSGDGTLGSEHAVDLGRFSDISRIVIRQEDPAGLGLDDFTFRAPVSGDVPVNVEPVRRGNVELPSPASDTTGR